MLGATLILSALAAISAAPTPVERHETNYVNDGILTWSGSFQGQDTAGYCLTVADGNFYDGSPVNIQPCGAVGTYPNDNAPQQWAFNVEGQTTFQLVGTNFCLDFGDGGGYDGSGVKIWTCYPGLFQQTFYYTADQHIAVLGGTQCLDVERGTYNVQSYQCSGGDEQQLWNGFF